MGSRRSLFKVELDAIWLRLQLSINNTMMSVPYALYAENTNIKYDSISNFLTNDSSFITNIGDGIDSLTNNIQGKVMILNQI